MSHWKIGVKILCSKSWEGQNSMKVKLWGSKFYFFLVEPLVKILCSLKRGVKILYFFPVPWKRGVKTAEPANQLHWRGAPPGFDVNVEYILGNVSLVNIDLSIELQADTDIQLLPFKRNKLSSPPHDPECVNKQVALIWRGYCISGANNGWTLVSFNSFAPREI